MASLVSENLIHCLDLVIPKFGGIWSHDTAPKGSMVPYTLNRTEN